METESPQGLNLHPAKQPRTTLFDWLPAGLPSVPTWRDLHGSLCVSLFPPSVLFFFLLLFPSHSLSCYFVSSELSLCPFPPFLIFGHLAHHQIDFQISSSKSSAMVARNALSRTMQEQLRFQSVLFIVIRKIVKLSRYHSFLLNFIWRFFCRCVVDVKLLKYLIISQICNTAGLRYLFVTLLLDWM